MEVNMGSETETSRNPLGLGIYRNLVSGCASISRIPNPEFLPNLPPKPYIPKYNRNLRINHVIFILT
ncbi:hypothetical protein RclHR1_00930013 [Rhizophagus clarus]|uniref:Uncharacterized protein n=1 Tax=Rhizophagus clarus TaxID=94130 RepID=A0A2Z6SEC4_9GLOM|nr:hypothetical protein RclHR1_00930013 [Rhizophagus clarus]GES91158.1 hypothetical protein RCL_e27968_RclHR1_00930013 [Rhizophagus clarus]